MMQTKYTTVCKPINDKSISYLIDRYCSLNLDNGPWIAGGVARRLWFGEPWYEHDIDFFFSNRTSFISAVKCTNNLPSKVNLADIDDEIASNAFKQITGDTITSRQKNAVHSTDNAISYRIFGVESGLLIGDYKIQYINRSYYSSIDDIWNDFDFTICNFATDGKIIIADINALSDCENKIIRMNHSGKRSPEIKRALKYLAYGFELDIHIIELLHQQYKNNTILEHWNIDDEYGI